MSCSLAFLFSSWDSNRNVSSIIPISSVDPALFDFQSTPGMLSPQINLLSSPQAEGFLPSVELFLHFRAFYPELYSFVYKLQGIRFAGGVFTIYSVRTTQAI